MEKLKADKLKCETLKLWINFRRKVLGQSHIDKTIFLFSHKGKQHTHTQLASNVMKLLPSEQESQQPLAVEMFSHNPELLVNKRIKHLFNTDGLQWYRESVIGYLKESQEFRVLYDNEDKECLYPLLEDMVNGEVLVFDH